MEIRKCKDLKGNKIFELIKYCTCENCKIRSLKRLHTKKIYVYFQDINKKNEAEEIAKNYICDGIYTNNSTFEKHKIINL